MIQLLSPRALDSTTVLNLPIATQGSWGLVPKGKRIRHSIGPRNSAEEKVGTPLAVGKIIIQSPLQSLAFDLLFQVYTPKLHVEVCLMSHIFKSRLFRISKRPAVNRLPLPTAAGTSVRTAVRATQMSRVWNTWALAR